MNLFTFSRRSSPTSIWLIGVAFVQLQLFLQLSSGIIIGMIMKEMTLSGLVAGLLSSALYVVYTCLQIPVGSLFDRKETRILMTINVLLCGIGCLLLAQSHELTGLFLGRILIGTGSSFAFVGLAHILRQYFPLNRFAFMIGLSETLGFCVSVIGLISLGALITAWGWRGFITTIGIVAFILAYLCWALIPDESKSFTPLHHHKQQLFLILKNKTAWINGFFVGLCFTIVTVFGALWSVPFIQIKLACSLKQASFITAMFFLGTGLSCPLFGLLSAKLSKRKPLMICSCLSTTFWLIVVIYVPMSDLFLMSISMFFVGLSCGAYMLAYTIANEISPPGALSTCAGFTNTLAVLTTPILQPLEGYMLDLCNKTHLYTLEDYHISFIILPLCTLTACVLVYFLPEKKCTSF